MEFPVGPVSGPAIIGWHLTGVATATLLNSYSYLRDVKKQSGISALVKSIGLMLASISVFLVEILLFVTKALPEFGVAGELILFLPSLVFVPLNLIWMARTVPVVIKSGRVRWYRALLVVIACLFIGVGIAV